MKTLLLYISIVNFYFVGYSQTIYIPDINFKNRLLQSTSTNNYALATAIGSIKVDINNDGEIQVNEALRVNDLRLSNLNINSLIGIEYFTNLVFFGFAYNNVSSVNLSSLTLLQDLGSYNNQLTSLNLSGLTNLRMLHTRNNLLTSLNFSGLPNLQMVDCGGNLINSLDFSANPLLTELRCSYSPNLTTINIKNNNAQNFANDIYFNDCWRNCPNLSNVCADAIEIVAVQNYLANCNTTQAVDVNSNCALANNVVITKKNITISPNPTNSLIDIISIDEQITAISLFDLQGRILKNIIVTSTETQLNLTEFEKGTYLVQILTDDGTTFVKKVVKN